MHQSPILFTRLLSAAIDKSTPCPILFGAPKGVFEWPSEGKRGRKEQCGGDADWVAANPPSPETTCKGLLHCHFTDAKTSLCERSGDMMTWPIDTCNRVGAGEQCGGDQAWVDQVCRAIVADALVALCLSFAFENMWSWAVSGHLDHAPVVIFLHPAGSDMSHRASII